MRILVVHLSDIHVLDAGDAVWARLPHIAPAVANLDYELDAALLLLSGDITQGGSEPEFILALDAVDSLSTSLSAALKATDGKPVPVYLAAVPGNHDGILVPVSQARDSIVQLVRSGKAPLTEPSILEMCVGPQAPFFQFLRAAETEPATPVGKIDPRLAYTYHLGLPGGTVEIVCLNSAAISTLHEQAGTLYVDPDWVTRRPSDCIARIAMIHHPFNWLSPAVSKKLHKTLLAETDLILTGHEHDADKRAITDTANDTVEHIEGGVLQERGDPSTSTFNALIIDTVGRRQKFAVYEWHDGQYELGARSVFGGDGGGLAWAPIQNDRFIAKNRWPPSQSFASFLGDPGVQLSHRHRAQVRLPDIYVFPNLHEFNPTTAIDGAEVDGTHLPERLLEAGKVVVVGDDASGKTSLCKMLFDGLYRLGALPVLLSGNDRPPNSDKVFGFLEDLYCKQYDVSAARVQQMERAQRVVIVDDLDKMGMSFDARTRLLERLAKFTDHVVVVVNELWAQLAETALSTDPDFRHFRIKPLSPVQRGAIIERWFMLDSPAEDQAEVARQVHRAATTINQLIGRNFVPSYAITVLTVLQAIESSTPIDTRASTQGYFYETLINAAIARGGRRDDHDIVRGFLSRLASEMFRLRRFSVDQTTFRAIHDGYQADYGIARDAEDLLKSLCNRQLLRVTGDSVFFRYRYIYYYFVANSLALTIHEPEVEQIVRELAQSLHVSESANTLLFLAHLTKHPVLVDALVDASRELQKDMVPARLESDVALFDALLHDSPPPKFIDVDDQHSRTQALAQQDAADADGTEGKINVTEMEWVSSPTSVAATLDPLARLNAGVKAMQILGQVLKNSPGTLKLEIKLRLMRELVSTGLVMIGYVHELFRQNMETVLTEIADIVRVTTPELTDDLVWERTKDITLFLSGGATFGLIKRMSQSMGARDLVATYGTVLKEDDSVVRRLVAMSLALDSAGGFPEDAVTQLDAEVSKRPFARRLLIQLVLRHFALFPEDFRLKQRVSERLGVSYSRIVARHHTSALIRKP